MSELKKTVNTSLLISCYVLISIVLYNKLGVEYALGSILVVWVINILSLFFRMSRKEIELEIVDKQIPEGFLEFARFSLNEEGELHSIIDKRVPKEFVIEALKQWLDAENKTQEVRSGVEEKNEKDNGKDLEC